MLEFILYLTISYLYLAFFFLIFTLDLPNEVRQTVDFYFSLIILLNFLLFLAVYFRQYLLSFFTLGFLFFFTGLLYSVLPELNRLSNVIFIFLLLWFTFLGVRTYQKMTAAGADPIKKVG